MRTQPDNSTTTVNDAAKTICPRCGSANRCALAVDPQAQNCWCFEQPFGTPLPVDDSLRVDSRASCYCARCLRELQSSTAVRRDLQNDA
jgi:hypothetical protein